MLPETKSAQRRNLTDVIAPAGVLRLVAYWLLDGSGQEFAKNCSGECDDQLT
jgi:hypothetical protein